MYIITWQAIIIRADTMLISTTIWTEVAVIFEFYVLSSFEPFTLLKFEETKNIRPKCLSYIHGPYLFSRW